MASNREPTNAELEAAFLAGFLAASDVLPGACTQRPPQDPPDFFVEHGGRRISIEVTRVSLNGRQGSALRAGEANRRWICRWLEEHLPLAGVRPLHVSIGFLHDALARAERGPLAAAILELIRKHDPRDHRPVDLDSRMYAERADLETAWPESLDHVSLLRPIGFSRYRVMKAEVGFEVSALIPLQTAIDDKGSALLRYAAHYDQNWLLVVAEGRDPSSLIEADQASREHYYRSPFDRAFFFQDFGRRWFEMRKLP